MTDDTQASEGGLRPLAMGVLITTSPRHRRLVASSPQPWERGGGVGWVVVVQGGEGLGVQAVPEQWSFTPHAMTHFCVKAV